METDTAFGHPGETSRLEFRRKASRACAATVMSERHA
jgi:hypothetical protein